MILQLATWLSEPNSTFWPLLLIIILMNYKTTRIPAILFIGLRCTTESFSYLNYVFLAIMITFSLAVKSTRSSVDHHVKHNTKRIDPDYK